MFHAYVLENAKGRRYIGSTGRFEKRIEEHVNQLAGWTRTRGPWRLVYSEEFATRAEAMAREKFLKSGQDREWLRKKLNGTADPPAPD